MARVPIHGHTSINDGGRLRRVDLLGGGVPDAGASDVSSGPSALVLDDLSDVDTTGVADGDTIVWDDGTDTWVPGDVAGPDTSLVTVAATGAAETVDCSVARTYDLTLDAACALTLTGGVDDETHFLTILLRESGAGGWAITWPGSVTWIGTPVVETMADAQIVNLLTVDGGTNWVASSGGTSSVAALDDLTDVVITTPAGGDNLRYRSGVWVNEPFEVGRWELVVTGSAPPVALTNDAEDDFLYALV